MLNGRLEWVILITFPGSKMTISGRLEIGLEDVPWTLAAHRIDLRTSVDPKMVQILTEIFKTLGRQKWSISWEMTYTR